MDSKRRDIDEDWEIVSSGSTSDPEDTHSESLIFEGRASGSQKFVDNTKEENLGLSSLADFNKFISNALPDNIHIPSRKSWNEVKVSSLTPSKIPLNSLLKKLVRYRGIPSPHRAQYWSLLSLTPAKYEKLKKKSTKEYYGKKKAGVFGGTIPEITQPPSFGSAKISISEHSLKDNSNTLQTLFRILIVLNDENKHKIAMPQLPDTVSMLLHYQSEADAFYTALSMLEQNTKYFQPTDPILIDSLIKAHIPKLYSKMVSLRIGSVNFADDYLSRLFIPHVPFALAMRSFDAYLLQGYEVLLRILLALLHSCKDKLFLATTDKQFISTLHESTKSLSSPAAVLQKAWKYKLSQDISTYEKKCKKLAKFGKDKELIESVPSSSTMSNSHSDLNVYYPKITFTSAILEVKDWNILYNWIPSRFRIRDPVLIHRLDREGTSLLGIYREMATYEPSIVVIKSRQQRVFGCYVSTKWRLTTDYQHIGTRECFLWTFYPEPKCFHWETGNMETFFSLQRDSMSMGAGGAGFGLSVTDEWYGTTNKCATFNNDPLNGDGDDSFRFEVAAMEIFALEG